MDYEVLGFYVHRDDVYSLNGVTVMVVIDEGYTRLTCYSPIGQHSEMDRGYFTECVRITKQEYVDASGPNGTPSEYLEYTGGVN